MLDALQRRVSLLSGANWREGRAEIVLWTKRNNFSRHAPTIFTSNCNHSVPFRASPILASARKIIASMPLYALIYMPIYMPLYYMITLRYSYQIDIKCTTIGAPLTMLSPIMWLRTNELCTIPPSIVNMFAISREKTMFFSQRRPPNNLTRLAINDCTSAPLQMSKLEIIKFPRWCHK